LGTTFFYISSFSVSGLVLMCVLSAYLAQKEGLVGEEGNTVAPSGKARALEFVKLVFMFFLYLGAAVVIVSMFTQRREDGATPVIPPSIKCVMILTTAYFVVYTLLWITTTAKHLRMSVSASTFVTNLSTFLEKRAKESIDFAPMLCILFLGTFMRALQITGGQGAPQPWAQTFMYVGTMAVVLLTVSRIDLLMFPQAAEGSSVGAKPAVPRVMAFFFVLQHLCLLLMHVAVVVLIVALCSMTPETAKGAGSIDATGPFASASAIM